MFHFYNPLKTSESIRFSDVFRGYRSRTLVENGLITSMKTAFPMTALQKSRSIFWNWLVKTYWKDNDCHIKNNWNWGTFMVWKSAEKITILKISVKEYLLSNLHHYNSQKNYFSEVKGSKSFGISENSFVGNSIKSMTSLWCFYVNFEHISHFYLVFLLLTLNK